MSDLRKCSAHSIAVNRCAECWPHFLRVIGNACFNALQCASFRRGGRPIGEFYPFYFDGGRVGL